MSGRASRPAASPRTRPATTRARGPRPPSRDGGPVPVRPARRAGVRPPPPVPEERGDPAPAVRGRGRDPATAGPRALRRRLLTGIAAAWLALPAAAQQEATILADDVLVEPGALTATGDVEVRHDGTVLTARSIRYDRETEGLTIEGPIRVDDGRGAVVTASAAALDADLEEGILNSARLTLDRQLQIAAAEVARIGDVSRLTRAVASSCHVCAGDPVPLWEIRAARVTYDEAAEILVFDRAQLRVSGVPVLYLPRLRLPGPGNARARGFLVPRIRSTSRLGTGIVAPYFLPIGRRADVTLSPYLSGETRTLGLRYRQAFRAGTLEIEGALVDDGLRDEARGYAFLRGRFDLPRDFALDLDLKGASDDAVLLDYGVSDEDRLGSSVVAARARPGAYTEVRLLGFQDLRGPEVAETSPRLQAAFLWDRRIATRAGAIDLALSGDAYLRDSSLSEDTDIDVDTIADGRDALRLGASAAWRGGRILPGGLVVEGGLGLDVDRFAVRDDDAFDDRITRILPSAEATLRWPLRRVGASGAVDVLEPALGLAWTPGDPDRPPNEDSARVELDEGNLLALSRFPGADAVERGERAALGLSWRRLMPGGWEAGATVGRVLRAEEDDRLPADTGLDGTASDWLAAVDLDTGGGLTLGSRALLGEGGVTRSEAVLGLDGEGMRLDAAYAWLVETTGPDGVARPRTSEVTLDADVEITRRWSGSAGLRYDFDEGRAQTAGLGVVWRNECAELDVSVLRRFEDGSDLEPETRFGFSVALLGFGDRQADPGGSTCDPVFR